MTRESTIKKMRFENLSFGFEGQDLLLSNVDFDFPMNELVWVRSEHGEGRSTLLQLLASLQNPTKGAYFINDKNVSEMSFEEFLPYRLKIGYGFDQGGLIHNRTIFENLMLPLLYHKVLSPKDSSERVTHYMKELGLWKYKDLRPSFVPGGSKKMACLIRALILHPEVLLLDDPTVGIPEEYLLKYFDVIKTLQEQQELRHIFICSFDEKFMSILDHQEVFLDSAQLYQSAPEEFRKVVSL